MKVFDLTCRDGHRFEGWFASGDAFAAQCASSTVRCPVCDSADVERAPSVPRLGRAATSDAPPAPSPSPSRAERSPAEWLTALRQLVAAVENVGPRFAEEARRMHYDETPSRAIRGTATARERRELEDEGIETLTIALPAPLTEPLQ